MGQTRRFCKTLQLKDDPDGIREYRRLHAAGHAWPEITEGMKAVGILAMEIYLDGTTLFMIMETAEDFDHDRAMARLAQLPRQQEWEATVARFQQASPDEPAGAKWRLMERIYSLAEQTSLPSNATHTAPSRE